MNEIIGRKTKMPMKDYHRAKGFGSTTLREGLRSMAHFKAKIDGKIPPKTGVQFDVGKVTHSCILEQDFSTYVCGPDVSKATKVWKEFEKEAKLNGKIALKPSDFEQVKGMFEAYFAHPLVSKITKGGVAEESFFCQDHETGLFLKARPDYIVESADGHYIVNYKTAVDASHSAFERSLYSYRYDFSEAHYIDVINQACGLQIKDSLFIVQEKVAPYAIGIYRSLDQMIERAQTRRRQLLRDIKKSFESNDWPCYPVKILDVDLPYYGITSEEMEIETNELKSSIA